MSDTTGLLDAILAVQSEAPTLKKSATNPHFKSKFAPLDEIVETIGPILHRHGLVWRTKPSFNSVGPTLKYEMSHAPSRESDEGEMPLLLSKNDAQGQGSAITYARRYALCAYLNLVADEDDDGGRAAGNQQRYGSKPAAKPAAQRHPELLALFRKHKVKAGEIRTMVRGAGYQISDEGNVLDAVDSLSDEQARTIVEFLKQGPAPMAGATDVPADGSEFVHEAAGDTPIELHG